MSQARYLEARILEAEALLQVEQRDDVRRQLRRFVWAAQVEAGLLELDARRRPVALQLSLEFDGSGHWVIVAPGGSYVADAVDG